MPILQTHLPPPVGHQVLYLINFMTSKYYHSLIFFVLIAILNLGNESVGSVGVVVYLPKIVIEMQAIMVIQRSWREYQIRKLVKMRSSVPNPNVNAGYVSGGGGEERQTTNKKFRPFSMFVRRGDKSTNQSTTNSQQPSPSQPIIPPSPSSTTNNNQDTETSPSSPTSQSDGGDGNQSTTTNSSSSSSTNRFRMFGKRGGGKRRNKNQEEDSDVRFMRFILYFLCDII